MRTSMFSLPAKAVFSIAGLVLAVGLAACSGDDDGPSADASTGATEFNDADVEFAQGMIPHHGQAVKMAQMVPDRTDTTEIRDLAADIEAAQQPEIDQLSRMLESWGADVPDATGDGAHAGHGTGDMAGMMSPEDMAGLEAASSSGFDHMWLEMMIEHHQGAITMSETVLAGGVNPDAKSLAEDIIDVQQREIDVMRKLLGGATGGAGHLHDDDDGEAANAAFGHIHGLGAAEDVLYVATHYGLFTVADDQAVRVSEDDHDFMGFTMVDNDSFLASGHPGSRTDLPANLGLLESTDGGRTWTDVSLSGEVDFHALDARHGVVYGLDSATGELMTSSDRENWERLGQVAVADVTISPENGDTIVVTTEQGPQVSSDGGRTFERLDDAPVLMLMDWPAAGQLYGVGPGGDVHVSNDDGRSWTDGATLGTRPQAMTVAVDGSVYIALEQSIVVSPDKGQTFSEVFTWQ